jgi:CopG family nickel-responsive transcriptional regulator
MSDQGVARITISLPPPLLDEFDQVIVPMKLDRSKAMQQAIRDFLTEYRWEHDAVAPAVGTVTLIYDHSVRGLEAKLTDIQHQQPDIITASMHTHLDENHCLLVVIVKGRAGEIQKLAKLLKGLRGVAQLKLTSLMVTTLSPREHRH